MTSTSEILENFCWKNNFFGKIFCLEEIFLKNFVKNLAPRTNRPLRKQQEHTKICKKALENE
jgi:hypothetical protein